MSTNLIPPEHLRVETVPSRPPGGQQVLDRSPEVRVTHLPSGLIAQSSLARSPHLNRNIAIDMILAALTHPDAPQKWLP